MEGNKAKPIKDQSVEEFLKNIGERTPTPGGGAAAATVAAHAAALLAKFCAFSADKKGLEHVSVRMREVRGGALEWARILFLLADEDCSAFMNVVYAKTVYAKSETEVMRDRALRRAADVPCQVAEICCAMLERISEVASQGNQRVRSDIDCAFEFASAACRAAMKNVEVNLLEIRDETMRQKMDERMAEVNRRLSSYQMNGGA